MRSSTTVKHRIALAGLERGLNKGAEIVTQPKKQGKKKGAGEG